VRILDLCCGAGGAAWGLHQAFPDAEIVGVDIRPQKNYPFTFVQGDALEFDLSGFDFVWASPPCQRYSTVSGPGRKRCPERYPDLLAPVRARLIANGAPWIIENVEGAPVRTVVRLCGSSFGLDVRRHRLFEAPFLMMAPACRHNLQRPRFRSLDSRQKTLASVIGVHGHLNYPGEAELRCKAMGIDWMTQEELTQAIPPAYARHLAQFIPLPAERAA
jgi:DNA (cytosine-5)-methyltransferase 1